MTSAADAEMVLTAAGDGPRAESDAAGAARGEPRRRTEPPAARDVGAPDPAATGAPGDGDDGAHMQCSAGAESAPIAELPAVCTEQEALADFCALVDTVSGALGLQARPQHPLQVI